MNWRWLLLLAALGLVVTITVAIFQPNPGYMDADYYFAGGMQLANGKGFTEPFIWNYLDDPRGIPHPSNAYWMPLASLLAAAGILLDKSASWISARIGFIAVAACLPPLTSFLSWSLTKRRDLALVSGFLAVFTAFYLPFLPVTDTFGIYMVLGAVFFLVLTHYSSFLSPLFLGLIAGLFHLTRADGLIWLLMAFIAVFVFRKLVTEKFRNFRVWHSTILSILLVLLGYLMVMLPWFIRNQFAFGALLAPGTSKALWLTSYDQLFSFPSSTVNFLSWWKSGLRSIMSARLVSLGMNISTAFSVQGEIFLFPFILVGYWHMRKVPSIKLSGLVWLLTFIGMTFLFPFAGARGGFFHSGAAVQPILWVLAPVGLNSTISWASNLRKWKPERAGMIFQYTAVAVAMVLSAVIIGTKVIGVAGSNPWGQENLLYRQIDVFLNTHGMTTDDVVMIANPPGFYLESGNNAIAIPDGDPNILLHVAHRYNARYLILEPGSIPGDLIVVFDDPHAFAELEYLGDVEGAQIYQIK